MGVVRVEKNKNFTVMSNFHLRDKTLTWKAKGLLSTMLSLPEEWDYSIAGLVTLSEGGATAVRTALVELEEHKYLTRRSLRKNGKIVDWEYTVYETPHDGKPVVDFPQLEKPQLENQVVENRTQINTKKTSTKKRSTKEVKNNNAAVRQNSDIEIEFENLWTLYPRKQGKSKAFAVYTKLRKANPELYKQVEDGIIAYKAYIKANKTSAEYIKHGSTWFNGKCWEDDYTTGGNPDGSDARPDATAEYDWENIGINL